MNMFSHHIFPATFASSVISRSKTGQLARVSETLLMALTRYVPKMKIAKFANNVNLDEMAHNEPLI